MMDEEMVDIYGLTSEVANVKGCSGRDNERATGSRVR